MRSPWLVPLLVRTNPSAHLICIPYAGAGASIFYPWRRHFPPSLALHAVQLPAREERLSEMPCDNLSEIVHRLSDAIRPLSTAPIVLFGHSIGALIAFEIASQLERFEQIVARRLLVPGRCAPESRSLATPVHSVSREHFIEHLREVGGTPQELLEDNDLLEVYFPALRADFAISETYRYEPPPPDRAYFGIHWHAR